jgi:predicted Rossmann fold nucleotide-binding protein DprA/Smf involved in DNA uptake
MNVIIAGSRTYEDYDVLLDCIKQANINITKVISGGASGADKLGERYAQENNKELEVYSADWNKHGKAAGPIRNRQMAAVADGLIALWDGKSPGTKNMIDEANKKNLVVYVRMI